MYVFQKLKTQLKNSPTLDTLGTSMEIDRTPHGLLQFGLGCLVGRRILPCRVEVLPSEP